MRDHGIEVHFATIQNRETLHEIFESSGISSTAFGAMRAADYPKVTARLSTLIRKERFDIIHASEAIAATLSGLSCLAIPHARSIFHYHHVRLTGKQRVLSRVGSRLADLVMNVSVSSQVGAMKFDNVRRDKTCVAYNGTQGLRSVSEQELEKARRDLAIGAEDRIITIVARLREEKGHRTLFAAMGLLARSLGEKLHLIVVGDGPDRADLEGIARSISDVSIHFVGSQDDVAPWVALADVVAVPSHIEAFGLAAVEAMSCGKPVVASRVGGLTEIIEERVSGLLVEPCNAADLAAAIKEILAKPELAVQLGKNARQRYLQTFTLERMVESWIACYSSVTRVKK